MADPAFREEQWALRWAPHIAPVNGLVDRLSDPDGREWMPYVAPLHGGTDATVLSLLPDPRPATQRAKGSGFLSVENDDAVAARQRHLLDGAGIDPRSVLPWTAYPWYTERRPSAGELETGVGPLARVVALAPGLEVAILQGTAARLAWRRLVERFPETTRRIKAVPTVGPGRTLHPDRRVRAERAATQTEAFRLARQIADDALTRA